jgi:CheY-like chemotaxis protein
MSSILVVEDDENTRLAVTEMLDVLGREDVRSASNGVEGLESVKDRLPDLMMLDLMMPLMDGFEVLRELRGGSAPRPGHIIVMSAHANKEDRAGVKQLGADQFLAKPFTLDELEKALENAGS